LWVASLNPPVASEEDDSFDFNSELFKGDAI